jgi:hypothetical protein
MLIDRMASLLQRSCEGTFTQTRSQRRASELSVGTLCSYGRRTFSRAICAVGRQDQDWSADYNVFSRSPWEAVKVHNLSRDSLEVIRDLRDDLNQMGAAQCTMLVVVDGSLCNRTVFKADLHGIE